MSGKNKNKTTNQPDNNTTREIENQFKELKELIRQSKT